MAYIGYGYPDDDDPYGTASPYVKAMDSYKANKGAYAGSYNASNYSKGTPQTYQSPYSGDFGKIRILNADGTEHSRWTVPKSQSDWFACASLVYPISELDKLPCVDIPLEHAGWTQPTGTVAFNACTFTATEDYLKGLWGRTLHHSDKDWLAKHPWSQDTGLGVAQMPMALHQLLAPYGFGVQRIRLRRGKTVSGEQLRHWMDVLGCNFMAIADQSTDNAQCAAALGMTLEQANDLFRFEFADAPFQGSVIGETGWTNAQGVQVGSQGGHARYLAPRGTPGAWVISITFAPLEQCRYLVQPEGPVYEPRTLPRTLSLSGCTRPDGKPIAVLKGSTYYPPDDPALTAPATTTTTPSTPAPTGTAPVVRVTKLDATGKPKTPVVRKTIINKQGEVEEDITEEYTHDGHDIYRRTWRDDGTCVIEAFACNDQGVVTMTPLTRFTHPGMPDFREPLSRPDTGTPADFPTAGSVSAADSAGATDAPASAASSDVAEAMTIAAGLLAAGLVPSATDDNWLAGMPEWVTTDRDDPLARSKLTLQEETLNQLELEYWPYSADTCSICDAMLTTDPTLYAPSGKIRTHLRYDNTALCSTCVATALAAELCPHCQAPALQVRDNGIVIPRLIRTEPDNRPGLPKGMLNAVFQCVNCAKEVDVNESDDPPTWPKLAEHVTYEFASPEQFEEVAEGADLIAEFRDHYENFETLG